MTRHPWQGEFDTTDKTLQSMIHKGMPPGASDNPSNDPARRQASIYLAGDDEPMLLIEAHDDPTLAWLSMTSRKSLGGCGNAMACQKRMRRIFSPTTLKG